MRKSKGITETIATKSKKRRSRLLKQSEQLLPGILDDVTLHGITTKLPWTALQILASVSHRWRQAIHSRQVYDGRVRCHSTETLVVLESKRLDVRSLGLYSMIERSSHRLPPVPYLERGIPRFMRSVALDGKIFVLGGKVTAEEVEDCWLGANGTDVFVLDLAGSMKWKRCASMLEPRAFFDSGVLDGKIYVFGGNFERKPVCGSEVYDPKRNVWSSIQPMKYMRVAHHVVTVGDEFFVFGGEAYEEGYFTRYGDGSQPYNPESMVVGLEVYHIVQNEWRLIEPFGTQQQFETLFTAQGKLHMLTTLGIYVHDTDSNTWLQVHSNSFPTLGPVDSIAIAPYQIVVENDQLLVGLNWNKNVDNPRTFKALLQSRGFGSDIKEIVWEKVVSCLKVGELMCSIKL